jgi:hypothetical protein
LTSTGCQNRGRQYFLLGVWNLFFGKVFANFQNAAYLQL